MKTPNRCSGFTLLEIVIVMAVLALLVGVVTPAVGGILRSKARAATIQEMEAMAEGALAHYSDVRVWPTGPDELMVSTTSGWAGPYMPGTMDDPWSGQSGYSIDGFGESYTFTANGVSLTMTSNGPDRTNGTDDDLSLVVNAAPVLRQETQRELNALNTAITQYYAASPPPAPLSGTWSAALLALEGAGIVPAGAGYETDGWGNAYQGVPVGVTPLTQVTSTFGN